MRAPCERHAARSLRAEQRAHLSLRARRPPEHEPQQLADAARDHHNEQPAALVSSSTRDWGPGGCVWGAEGPGSTAEGGRGTSATAAAAPGCDAACRRHPLRPTGRRSPSPTAGISRQGAGYIGPPGAVGMPRGASVGRRLPRVARVGAHGPTTRQQPGGVTVSPLAGCLAAVGRWLSSLVQLCAVKLALGALLRLRLTQ